MIYIWQTVHGKRYSDIISSEKYAADDDKMEGG